MQELGKGVELAGRYALVDRLGSGGAAEIWLAEDRLTSASVALKVRVADRVGEDDFRGEWQTSLRLMHAHIVRVFEFHDDSGLLFYSMQYVDGPEIGVLSGAPLEHVLPPVAAVADALRYAHGKGVVHRDVKPGNVLLDHDGAPFLVDFGVAARRDRIATGGSLIAASPQSLAGAPAQAADDVFALGGLIYELVSGASPYSSSATEDDILHKVPPPLTTADGSPVPGDLQRLVAAMLDKAAESRPDAHGVVDRLAALGASPGAAPAGYAGKTRNAGVDVIEVSRAARPRRSTDAPVPPPEADRRAGLSPRLVWGGLAVLLSILVGVVFILPDTVQDEHAEPTAADSGVPAAGAGDGDTQDDAGELPSRDERVTARAETDAVLGELLAKMETLESRAVQRWAGLKYKQAQAAYAAGDDAYLARDYARATEKYREAIDTVEPLLEQVDSVFENAYEAGLAALEAADSSEALRQLELAVAISPDHAGALAGLARARNLDTVLALTDQGLAHENDLELEAARRSFADAVDLDPEWEPASEGLERVLETIRQRDFDRRMTEGFAALDEQDYAAARAAFRTAQKLKPESREPADGLLQVDQAVQLNRIAVLQQSAVEQTRAEQWEAAIETYESILEIDPNLSFALQGLDDARRMSALHAQLDDFIEDPDSLSAPATMARATRLVVDITRMPEIGPRLADRRDTLSRLLKRAATPLTVHLVSDNQTSVSIYKVGKLGAFETRELELRPGTYVAVGSRPGYRDVRLEFRVGPEVAAGPIVVRCEEKI